MKRFKQVLIIVGLVIFNSCGEKTIDLTGLEYEDLFSEDSKGVYYKNKLFTGKIVKYKYKEGPLLFESTYENGKSDGESVMYWNNGSPNKIWEFSNDSIIKFSHFYEDGTIHKQFNNNGNFLIIESYENNTKDTLLFTKFNENHLPEGKWIEYRGLHRNGYDYETTFTKDTVFRTLKNEKKSEKINEKYLYNNDSDLSVFFPDSTEVSTFYNPELRRNENTFYFSFLSNEKWKDKTPLEITGKYERLRYEGYSKIPEEWIPKETGFYKNGKRIGDWSYGYDRHVIYKNNLRKRYVDNIDYSSCIKLEDGDIIYKFPSRVETWDNQGNNISYKKYDTGQFFSYNYYFFKTEGKILTDNLNKKYLLLKNWNHSSDPDMIYLETISLTLLKNECLEQPISSYITNSFMGYGLSTVKESCRNRFLWGIVFSNDKMKNIYFTDEEGKTKHLKHEQLSSYPYEYYETEEMKTIFNDVIEKDINKFKINISDKFKTSYSELPKSCEDKQTNNTKSKEENNNSINSNNNTPTIPGKYPQYSTTQLKPNELTNMSLEELQIMRNEIFGRHGYIFKEGGEMNEYFSKQSWYKPQFSNVDSKLTPIEKSNIELILNEEKNKESSLNDSHMTGLIKGNKINFRSTPSTESNENIIGELNEDYKVTILDKKVVGTNEDFRITKVKTIFKPLNGGSSYSIEKGVSVKYLSEDSEKCLVLINTDKGYINRNDLKSMEGVSWRKIQYKEKVGWVYSDFIKTIK